jgi:hypothetical protein
MATPFHTGRIQVKGLLKEEDRSIRLGWIREVIYMGDMRKMARTCHKEKVFWGESDVPCGEMVCSNREPRSPRFRFPANQGTDGQSR